MNGIACTSMYEAASHHVKTRQSKPAQPYSRKYHLPYRFLDLWHQLLTFLGPKIDSYLDL